MTGILGIPKVTRRAYMVWRRNLEVFVKTWKVNFLPPFIEAPLYLSAIGLGVGSYITGIGGVPYVDFIAPAILAIAVMTAAFFECTYGSYIRMYYQKSFDAMIATPLSLDDVIAGEILWGATKSVLHVAAMISVLAAFGVISLPLSLLALPLAFLGGLLFSGIAMCCTALSPGIDALNYPAFLFVTPMTLFTGTFFPLDQMPVILQEIAIIFLPLTHVVALMRMLTLASPSWIGLLSLVWICAITALICLVAINLMKRRLIV